MSKIKRKSERKINSALGTYSRAEIAEILSKLRGTARLKVGLMYGSGLRQSELLSLRVKDINFDNSNIFVRGGKDGGDRTTLLPQSLIPALVKQISLVKKIHAQDIADGYGDVSLPAAESVANPSAAKEISWQFLFSFPRRERDLASAVMIRNQLHPFSLTRLLNLAFAAAKIHQPPKAHVFRMSFAAHLLESGQNERTIQGLLGLKGLTDNEAGAHVMYRNWKGVISPLDNVTI